MNLVWQIYAFPQHWLLLTTLRMLQLLAAQYNANEFGFAFALHKV